jgi:nucleoside-diphosphate-sugar epimerase
MKNPLANDLDHVLDYTRDLWDELRGERLFITGGTGFFGCWLLESFLWANQRLDLKAHAVILTRWLLESFLWANERLKLNAQATVLSRNPQAFMTKSPRLALNLAVTLLQGNVRSFDFPAGTFSHMIHAAAEASAQLNADAPLLMLDTIVEGTRRTLDFSMVCGTKKFLLVSSGAVYGKQPRDLTHIPEDYPGAPNPLDPGSAYGQGKRLAEYLCVLYAPQAKIEMKIARCFAFVGPYMPLDIHFAIGNFIRDGLNGGPIVILGDGTPRRSYLYASDLAIWLWTILFRGVPMRPYNVGSDESFSIAEVAHCVAKQFHKKLAVEIRGKANPNMPAERYVPSTYLAQNELNLKTTISLHISIMRTKKWNFQHKS